MPLLHRKPFIRQKPPADLRPDEEVFLCKITHEIFRTYDEFFERTILCNSLVWSCALTGRVGLTYLEAVESERRARQSLESFPQSLVVPLLHLAALSQCCRLTELCEDVYTFVKDRFFPGEVVDVSGCNGARYVCEILQVHLPDSSVSRAPDVNGHGKMADDDTIVISDSDDEHNAFQSSTVQVNGRKKSLSPSVFKYTVRMMKNKHSEPFTVTANQISRKKSALSRERLKLLFKQHCEPQNGIVTLKPSSMAKYQLSKQTFSQFFPDEPPLFSFSPSSKCGRRDSPGQASSSLLKAAEEKLKLLQQREEMVAAAQDKARLKKEKEEVQEAKRREREDKERLREEQRRRFEEEKQRRREEKERRKLEKDREREKLKEEKKKYAEQLKLWSKPREDMDCEDLKELPRPIPVKTRLPAELFGDALMVLEFLQAFGEAFDLKDEFPDGVSLEVLEEALVGSDPEGPLCELLFFFLTAIFQALDEEQEEVATDQVEDLTDALDDDSDPTCSALSAIASLAAAWPQLHQGCTLKQLDLDSCTLSEILRLHILASGADCNHGNAKFRYQKQGGFTVMDDPCVELRLADPALLKKLSSTAVYDLTPGEKLRILQALVGKVLTLASSRDLIEDCVEEQRAARHELREIRAEQHRREREEAAHRVRLRKEEKMREQEQRMRAKEEKMKEQELKGRLQTNGDSVTEHHAENEEEQSSKIMKAKGNQKEQQQQTVSDLKPPTSLTAEELGREQEKLLQSEQTGPVPGKRSWERKIEKEREKTENLLQQANRKQHSRETMATTTRASVRELQERIQKAAACTCLLPLGRDRLYRRYWLFPSASALFVEADYFGLTEDMLQPSPKPDQDTSTTKVEKGEEVAKDEAASAGTPINQSNQWSFYSSLEEVDQLIEALNPRGHRESSLKEALLQERERLQHLLKSCDRNKYEHTEDQESSQALPECTAAAESMMEVRLRELLLDIEDRIHQGTLGTLKVMDRQIWRSALEAGNYELLTSDGRENTGMNGRVEAMEVDCAHLRARDRLQEVKSDSSAAYGSSGSGTPQVVSSSVRILAQALAHIEQGIDRRFLKAPLADEDSKKDHKMKNKKKKDEDQASDDGSDCGRVSKTVLERWRESLQSCSSLSQVFVHLSSLERSILWSRSILNARCRICRCKGDADNMVLCDSCDRGHHTHCLRPRMKSVPEGEWFCPDCRPKQRSNRLPSRQRSSIDEEEERDYDDEEEEEEQSEEEEEEESEEESEEEEEEEVVVILNPKKRQTPLPKGKSQQATPKNSITTSGKNTSASKSSGKKPITPPASDGKIPTRSRSRTAAHVSHENVEPNSHINKRNTKTSPAQSESRKRSLTETAAPRKLSRPILPVLPSSHSPGASSSSSNRRSSGRNQGVHELSACEQLTVELVRHEDSWPFMKLVSRTQVPDYYDIIKKPIALNTIREKVNNCEYQTAGEYISDVELMFSNCLQYNPRHTNEAKAGHRLQRFFHAELSRLGLLEHVSALPTKRSRH
ncbi:bromodomain adjacent to zinc finger domain protein 1A isoform X1 [Oreochromis aureus]|uniref:bromodomain adjacent to zinc finger domain protein 1A isoform X1 n=1 Tax=Oreochromis aureus TaxID=47969 RepID=UPI001952E6F8|nr:bromodomain adjacent to zinc finger domain protein 1A isoform X1 [Oreochromis aureus]XP_039459145.1 bromodomain adjacent to zinc finger domain protein 1A isoform X1 [Oreochromis aureus]